MTSRSGHLTRHKGLSRPDPAPVALFERFPEPPPPPHRQWPTAQFSRRYEDVVNYNPPPPLRRQPSFYYLGSAVVISTPFFNRFTYFLVCLSARHIEGFRPLFTSLLTLYVRKWNGVIMGGGRDNYGFVKLDGNNKLPSYNKIVWRTINDKNRLSQVIRMSSRINIDKIRLILKVQFRWIYINKKFLPSERLNN